MKIHWPNIHSMLIIFRKGFCIAVTDKFFLIFMCAATCTEATMATAFDGNGSDSGDDNESGNATSTDGNESKTSAEAEEVQPVSVFLISCVIHYLECLIPIYKTCSPGTPTYSY